MEYHAVIKKNEVDLDLHLPTVRWSGYSKGEKYQVPGKCLISLNLEKNIRAQQSEQTKVSKLAHQTVNSEYSEDTEGGVCVNEWDAPVSLCTSVFWLYYREEMERVFSGHRFKGKVGQQAGRTIAHQSCQIPAPREVRRTRPAEVILQRGGAPQRRGGRPPRGAGPRLQPHVPFPPCPYKERPALGLGNPVAIP